MTRAWGQKGELEALVVVADVMTYACGIAGLEGAEEI